MDIVNENTTYRIVCEFSAEDGAPVTPFKLMYRLDDVISDTTLIDTTIASPAPSASSHVVTIPAVYNSIIDNDSDTEERVLTVQAEYGQGKIMTGEYRYLVRNLSKAPMDVVLSISDLADGDETIGVTEV